MRRKLHHNGLERIAAQTGKPQDGLALWRKLRRLENEANIKSLAYADGQLPLAQWEHYKHWLAREIAKLFGALPKGFFINSDPRGHVLKLEENSYPFADDMQRDWGNDIILAAEVNS